jgi:hypothetical protein
MVLFPLSAEGLKTEHNVQCKYNTFFDPWSAKTLIQHLFYDNRPVCRADSRKKIRALIKIKKLPPTARC